MVKSPPIFILGGVPGIGKTSLARKLAKKLGYDFISTDMVRKVMLSTTNKKQFPKLHELFLVNADKYFANVTFKKFLNDFKKESLEVYSGLEGVLYNNKSLNNKNGVIIEGSVLLPEIINKLKKKTNIVYSLFVIAENITNISENIDNRGLWTKKSNGKKHEKEMIFELNKYIKSSAEKNGYKIIYARPYENILNRAVAIIKNE